MRTATIYNFLLEANLMAGIAIVLMVIVRKCFRRQLGNRAIYFAWLLVAIRLLCPLALPNPAINQIRPYWVDDQAIRPIAGQLKVRFADASQNLYRVSWGLGGEMDESPVSEALDRFVDTNYNGRLSYVLMQVYACGAVAVLCWFSIANLRFRHRLKADRIESISGKLLEQYQALCQTRGVKPVPVYFTDPLPSACLVGTLRPYIALPLSAKPQETIQVLTHEVSHLKGHDNLWAVLRLLCCIVHWFNPLVWLAADMSRADGELACDDRVVQALNPEEKIAYANVLVLAAARRNAPGVAVLATGMTMTGRKLKTRVNAILHSGHMKKGFAIAFVLLASMALVGAFATGEYTGWPAIPVYGNAVPVQQRSIDTAEEALAYAQTIWANPYLKQDMSNVTWRVENYIDPEGQFEVYASSPKFQRDCSLYIQRDGKIISLNNGDCGKDIAGGAKTLYGDKNPEQRDALYAFILRTCDMVFPGVTDTITGHHSGGGGSHSNNSQYFAFFYAETENNRYAYSFEVQTVPVVRLVGFHWDAFDEMADMDAQFNATPQPVMETAAAPDSMVTISPHGLLPTLAPTDER